MKDMRPDRDPERLRALLDKAAPAAPSDARRMDGVRGLRRRGRWQGATLAATAVAAVALSVIIVPHFFSTSPVSTASSPPVLPPAGRSAPNRLPAALPPVYDSKRARPGHLPALTCPVAGRAYSPASVQWNGLIPSGAVRAKLCPLHPSSRGIDPTWLAPAGELTTRIGELVTRIDASRPEPADTECFLRGSEFVYTITFQYPDGRLARIVGDLGGCGAFGIGSTDEEASHWFGAKALLGAYLQLAEAQRTAATAGSPSGARAPLSCPSDLATVNLHASLLPADNRLIADSGVICSYDPNGAHVAHSRQLTPAEALAVSTDYRTHVGDMTSPLCRQTPHPLLLVLRDSWGDVVELMAPCDDVFRRMSDFLPPGGTWRPGPAVRPLIDSVLHS